jgi:hypothetical protein
MYAANVYLDQCHLTWLWGQKPEIAAWMGLSRANGCKLRRLFRSKIMHSSSNQALTSPFRAWAFSSLDCGSSRSATRGLASHAKQWASNPFRVGPPRAFDVLVILRDCCSSISRDGDVFHLSGPYVREVEPVMRRDGVPVPTLASSSPWSPSCGLVSCGRSGQSDLPWKHRF